MASGTGMLVNSAETSYNISFCPGGTSRFLILSTKSPLFLMWRSDFPTRGSRMSANTLIVEGLVVEGRSPFGS